MGRRVLHCVMSYQPGEKLCLTFKGLGFHTDIDTSAVSRLALCPVQGFLGEGGWDLFRFGQWCGCAYPYVCVYVYAHRCVCVCVCVCAYL